MAIAPSLVKMIIANKQIEEKCTNYCERRNWIDK